MYKVISLFVIHVVGLTTLALGSGQNQQKQVPPLPLPSRAEINDTDWNARRVAFGKLIGADQYEQRGAAFAGATLRDTLRKEPSSKDSRTTALIELLKNENAVVSKKEKLTDGYLNYYADVIAAVASLEDRRSLDVMLEAITTGGMATRALIALGPVAMKPVALKLDSPDAMVRSAAARTLSQALTSEQIRKSPESRSTIKNALTKASSDADHSVRRNSIDGLIRLGDPESIRIVEKIAKTDPYRANYPGKEGRYIVREDAAAALAARAKRGSP